jgi:hypothetical protein
VIPGTMPKKTKKYAKDKGLSSWEDMAVSKDFKHLHVTEGI